MVVIMGGLPVILSVAKNLFNNKSIRFFATLRMTVKLRMTSGGLRVKPAMITEKRNDANVYSCQDCCRTDL